MRDDLFIESEKKAVFEDQKSMQEWIRQDQEAKHERERIHFEYQQQQKRDEFYQNLQLAPIQGALTGGVGVFGNLVKGAYTVYSIADTGVQTYRAATTGTPSDVVGSLLPLASGMVFNRMVGGFEPTTPIPEGGVKPVTGLGLEEVTPNQVRQAYRANRFAVKKSTGSDFHQQQWEANGGTGKAPIAFRMSDGTAIRVDEQRWLAVGELSEINTPADLAPPRAPRAPAANTPAVDPLARTGAVVDPWAGTGAAVDPLARTGAPAVDPLAHTGAPVVDPLADTPAPARPAPAAQKPVDPKAQTQNTLPPVPKVVTPPAPRGYTRVAPEVVIEAYEINPNVISTSGSTEFHQMVWERGGGRGTAPVAYRVGDLIRVDMVRWPASQRGLIGQGMNIKP
jgi:hypothetical protein